MRGQPMREGPYAVRFSYGVRFSPLKASRALLIVFGCSVAAGYAAGSLFRPSSAAIAPQPPAIRRYIAVETPLPQPLVPSGTFSAKTPESGSAGLPPWLPVAPRTGRPAVAVSPSAPSPEAGSPAGRSSAGPAAGGPALEPRFYVEVSVSQDPAQADAVAKDLRRRGYAAHAGSGPGSGVRIGGWLDRPTAERLVRQLSAAGFDAALVAH
jgi:DedD protein